MKLTPDYSYCYVVGFGVICYLVLLIYSWNFLLANVYYFTNTALTKRVISV